MKTHIPIQFICLIATIIAEQIDTTSNKTKRTVAPQIGTYAERPVVLYPQNPETPIYKPFFEPEVPKQVAAQQVLYEFQQTPTNAVSNVHVNQYYQPLHGKSDLNPNPHVSGSETIATPVQHSSLVRHGQNYGQVQFQPPQHIQTQQYVPGKYLYVNGKILYQPQPQIPVLPPQQRQNYYPQQRFLPQPIVPKPRFRQFSPPDPIQFQPITKPLNVPQVTEEPKEEPEEEPEEENEEVDEENESYEEEDDDEDRYYSNFNDDEHNEDDDEEDSERGSSKTVTKKQKKVTKPSYKYKESYKYESPSKKTKKSKGPKKNYKTFKYTRDAKNERIEGRPTQNVPVVHKQKIFKEKWFVTKSTDDST